MFYNYYCVIRSLAYAYCLLIMMKTQLLKANVDLYNVHNEQMYIIYDTS